MTKLALFFTFCISINCSCYGQTKAYSEKYIYKLFKKSVLQTDKGKIKIPSNPWLICNQDSSFYRNDTVRLFSNSYYTNSVNCCECIGWTFYEKDKFISTNFEFCKEPTTASAFKDKDHFRVLVSSADNYLLLSTFNNDKLIETFKIINVEYVRLSTSDLTSTVVTLLRVAK
ncbi:hypothetical protein [Arcicella rigui]|uniref:Lipocalin-like domain-containing protein n=1 Tax=Arcicella rigui TaxID=797020 RepID=A0ABU5Q901_9BACT|nr:hypothetical protein [Arcicella rigui]MEA5139062.1 hypothetical protein [Arcicella rigui]